MYYRHVSPRRTTPWYHRISRCGRGTILSSCRARAYLKMPIKFRAAQHCSFDRRIMLRPLTLFGRQSNRGSHLSLHNATDRSPPRILQATHIHPHTPFLCHLCVSRATHTIPFCIGFLTFSNDQLHAWLSPVAESLRRRIFLAGHARMHTQPCCGPASVSIGLHMALTQRKGVARSGSRDFFRSRG
jgi:hypothetical protein